MWEYTVPGEVPDGVDPDNVYVGTRMQQGASVNVLEDLTATVTTEVLRDQNSESAGMVITGIEQVQSVHAVHTVFWNR